MGTFTPATTYNPYSMLLPDARSAPDEAQRRAAGALQFVLEGNPPSDYGAPYSGGWSASRYEQILHFRNTVAVAIDVWLTGISSAKPTLYRRRTKRVVKSVGGQGFVSRDDSYTPLDPDEHPLAKVLEQPGGENGTWSLRQEMTYLGLQYLLTDGAPAWVPHNADGKPVRFFALTSADLTWQIRAGQDQRYPKGAYRVTPMAGTSAFGVAGRLGTYALLPGEEVGWLRRQSPAGRSLGVSRLQTAARQIDILEAITESRWATFDHGVQLDAAMILPGLSEDEGRALRQSIEQKHGGARNARRFIVVSGSGLEKTAEIKLLAPNVREIDYNASYEQVAGEVLSHFKVPKQLANFNTDSNYSGDWAAEMRFYNRALAPFCRGDLSDFLTQTLARPWESEPGELKIEVEPEEPKNREEENKERQFAVQAGVIKVNDYLMATGRKPDPEGDVPLQTYLAKQQQAVAPPAMPGAPGGLEEHDQAQGILAEGGQEASQNATLEEHDQPDTPEATQDAVANAALAALGVPAEEHAAPLAKAVYDEAKHARDRGKFSAKPGAAGRVGHPSAKPRAAKPPADDDYARTGRVAPWGLGTSGGPKDFPGTEHLSEHAKSVPASTPTARKTLLSVKTWARMHADRHADKVAKHFGIPREKAHQLLLHAIVETAKLAAKHGSTRTTGTLNQGGMKLRVNINGRVAPGGAVPKPSNPDAAGSRGAPVVKAVPAASTPDFANGGALVQTGDALRRRKRVMREVLARRLKALDAR